MTISGEKSRPARGAARSEWIVGIVSGVLLFALVGYLVYDGVRSREAPPSLAFHIDTVVPTATGYLVRFRAENRGDETAAAVQIEGVLSGPSGVLESSETTIEFAPARGSATAGMYFSRDPRAHRLELRARGYRAP